MILFTFSLYSSESLSADERKLAPNLNECWWVAALDVVGMSDDVAAFVDIVRRDFIVKNTKWIRRKDDVEKRGRCDDTTQREARPEKESEKGGQTRMRIHSMRNLKISQNLIR